MPRQDSNVPYANYPWKAKQVEEHRCVWCARKLPEKWASTRCASCISDDNRRGADRRKANRAKGLCACGNPPRESKKTCITCYNYYKDWLDAHRKMKSRQKSQQAEAAGESGARERA